MHSGGNTVFVVPPAPGQKDWVQGKSSGLQSGAHGMVSPVNNTYQQGNEVASAFHTPTLAPTSDRYYNQQPSYYPPSRNWVPTRDEPFVQQAIPGGIATHNHPTSESGQRTAALAAQPPNPDVGHQSSSWNGGSNTSPALHMQISSGQGSSQRSYAGPTYPQAVPQADGDQSHPMEPWHENQPKGSVVLAWTPNVGPRAPNAVATPPESAQQAEASSSEAEPQSSDSPELHLLRERLQRLEVALVERAQPPSEVNVPDRPPPAYDSRPASPVDSSNQGTRLNRTGGTTS